MTSEGYRETDYRSMCERLEREAEELRNEVARLRAANTELQLAANAAAKLAPGELQLRALLTLRPKPVERTCEKCGDHVCSAKYARATPEVRGWFGRVKSMAYPEHLDVRCFRCGFEWTEPVLAPTASE